MTRKVPMIKRQSGRGWGWEEEALIPGGQAPEGWPQGGAGWLLAPRWRAGRAPSCVLPVGWSLC